MVMRDASPMMSIPLTPKHIIALQCRGRGGITTPEAHQFQPGERSGVIFSKIADKGASGNNDAKLAKKRKIKRIWMQRPPRGKQGQGRIQTLICIRPGLGADTD